MITAAALALAAIAIVTLRWPFVGLLVYLWFDFMRPHDFLVELCALRPMLIIGTATFAGVLWQQRRQLLDTWRRLLPLLALVATVALSTIQSSNPTASLGVGVEVVKMLALVWLLLVVVSTDARFDAVLWVIALSLLVLAISGIVQGIERNVMHEFQIDRVATGPPGEHGGPFHDNNDLARVLALSVPLWWTLALRHGWSRRGVFAALAFLVTIAGIEFTFSRGGFLALVAAVSGASLAYRPWWRALLIPPLFVAVLLAVAPRPYFDRIATLGRPGNESSLAARLQVWRASLKVIAEHPLSGQGPGTLRVGEAQRTSHNIFVEVFAETGAIGLIAYVWMLVAAFVGLRRVRQRAAGFGDPTRLRTASWGLQAALLAYLTASLALGGPFHSPLFVLIGLASALRHRVERPLQTP